MDKVKHFLATALLLGGTLAHAEPAEIGGAAPLEVLNPAKTGRACLVRGAVCVSAGGLGTVLQAAPGDDKRALPPTLARAATVAAHGNAADARGRGWTVELDALLARPALSGNALFLFYDLADPASVANHEVTAMQQAPVRAGRAVAARVRLASDDGFAPGHTYRAQIVQLIGGREIVLAQGDFTLR